MPLMALFLSAILMMNVEVSSSSKGAVAVGFLSSNSGKYEIRLR